MSINQNETAAQKDHYKVHRREPGCDVVTDFKDGRPVLQNPPIALAPAPPSLLPSITQAAIEKAVMLSPRDEIAHYRIIFVKALEEEISKKDAPVLETVKRFLFGYNSGYLLPMVRKKLGPISWRTAYRFREAFDKGGVESLIPGYGKKGISKITEHEKNLLLTLLLHPNRLKVAYAITLTKNYLKRQGIESPSSDRTLRRFADEFKREHYDLWVLHREGEKALDDNVLPYIERDRNLLEVGEGLVADGHRMNFEVIDPFTGRPCRAAVVFFWDWRSSYPLGWEIMLEENVQCISTALRNAILTLGKKPKWILIDNGKAFKAKVFTSDINLTETEILGMFARLNINVHFASPYNAKSKPIERFFKTFGDQFERLMESFIGSSIEDKPAWTKRNEKLARSLHNPRIPMISEINDRMFEWREFYVDQPSKGLRGQIPREIFETGKGPGLDPGELTYLMMSTEDKLVTRNGIDLFGCHWYDEALYGIKDRVIIKYSLSDLSQIYCFYKNEFLCTLRPLAKTHPMASESGTPKDMEDVKRKIAQKRGLKKQTVKLYKMLGHKADSLPWKEIIQEIPNIPEIIEKMEAEKPKKNFISPFVDGVNYGEETEGLTLRIPDKDAVIVDPRSGLTRPDGPAFDNEFEYYEFYAKIEKKLPGTLNDKDREWIREYEATEQWKQFYEGKTLFPISKPKDKSRTTERPWFKGDYEKYDWLMKQDSFDQDDRDFIREFRKESSLYKHTTFDDDEELDKKIIKEPEANLSRKGSGKHVVIVDPRTGLSRPADGTIHEDQWEKYDWYMAVKKESPEALNNLDHEWIAEYEATDQWRRIYGSSEDAWMARTSNNQYAGECQPEAERPLLFNYAFERYEYLLKKYILDHLEKQFIEDYRSGKIAPGEWESIYGQKRLT